MVKQTMYQRFPVLATIPEAQFPKHIFIIPDGNGRWAKTRNVFVTEGHKKGFAVVETLLDDLSELKPVEVITVWGFSSDNWKRSKEEVKGLMFIFTYMMGRVVRKIKARNGRFIHLGRKDRLPKKLLQEFDKGEKETTDNSGQIVATAIDFGGEDQDIRVAQKVQKLPKSTIIDSKALWQLRDGNGKIRSADLLIRTSGEKRTSDVGWLNGTSTELYFTPKLFPDITIADLVDAIVDFSKRERRFGGRE